MSLETFHLSAFHFNWKAFLRNVPIMINGLLFYSQRMGLENDANAVRRELQELEEEVNKAEAEKTKRDHTMRGLNDEINSQEDAIQKLNREKKFYQENTSRADEELQGARIFIFIFVLLTSSSRTFPHDISYTEHNNKAVLSSGHFSGTVRIVRNSVAKPLCQQNVFYLYTPQKIKAVNGLDF